MSSQFYRYQRQFRQAVLAIVCLCSTIAFAAPEVSSGSGASESARWHYHISSGLGKSTKDAHSASLYDAQKAQGGDSEYIASFDLPQFTYRATSELGVGGGLNLMFEHVSRKFKEQRSTAFHFFNVFASANYFWAGDYGLGFFNRLDLGYSELHEYIEVGDPNFNIYRGLFIQAGLGYGLPATAYGSLLLQGQVFYIPLANDRFFSGALFSLGFLLHP